jgi:SSS family solute:Na+ symporter/sodium/proline symporter
VGFYLWVVLGYLVVLAGFNFYRARKVESQEDFMVAGRKLSLTTMVFTLVCTWIGSGTFIAGAEYAAKAGWSSLWLPAGAWVGIAVIYFLAAKIRTFGQYTVGDILEVRYGKTARLLGAVALIIAFTTIVSYQFRAGGYILNVATKGAISVEAGQAIAAAVVILFTAVGGMVAVAHTDLPNGIIILLACCAALPFAVLFAGGTGAAAAHLPPQHFAVFSADFGEVPALKAGGYFLATLLLLLGIQSMYQKFYSARSPAEARRAVALWILGTILVETLVVVIAIYAAAAHWSDLKAFDIAGSVKREVAAGTLPAADAPRRASELVRAAVASAQVRPGEADKLAARLEGAFSNARDAKTVASVRVGIDPASIVLQSAEDMASRGGLGLVVGLLLLGAACAVVLSTGMNYLLSPTTNIMRDIYQRFVCPDADQKRMVALQKVFVVLLGVAAFLMIFVPTVLGSSISVLRYSYFAYTMYGVAITPALIAALAWKRATRAGGLASIISGAGMTLLLEVVIPGVFPSLLRGGDPFGIPSIFPSALVSIGMLVVVSFLTRPPTAEQLEPLFGKKAGEAAAR